jgi:hypothetical protein
MPGPPKSTNFCVLIKNFWTFQIWYFRHYALNIDEKTVNNQASKQYFSYLGTVTITSDRAANLDLCLDLRLLAVRVLLRATPILSTATRDLRYNVISERPVILTFECCALGEGAITTYFKRFRLDEAVTSGARTHNLPDAKREHYH